MKKMLLLVLSMVLLCGCQKEDDTFGRTMALRTRLINGAGCRFDCSITADYGDKIFTFSLHCEGDQKGNLRFTVTAPETISGITGTIDGSGGKLTFDDTALAFELQTDDLLSPISAPWLLLRGLRGGYVRSTGLEDGLLRAIVDDSYEEDALTVDVWLDGQDRPIRGDIYEENRRILTIELRDFTFV